MDFDVLIGTDEISIHALREEGDLVIFFLFLLLPISIHALREEGDGRAGAAANHDDRISIHALREEGDLLQGVQSAEVRDFYPRPPRGGRQTLSTLRPRARTFLSTPSARRAT